MLHVLSLKSRVTIINNLVVPTIWHKVIALQPPRDLVANIQKVLINFFLGRPSLAQARCVVQAPTRRWSKCGAHPKSNNGFSADDNKASTV